MKRFIEVDETIRFEVSFSVFNREEGFEDDIRFAIADTAPPGARLFEADEIGILLTPAQAEQLAAALLEATRMSRATPLVSEENMATKSIPNEIKQQADVIVANFNQTVIQDPENFYVTRYRGLHLYLDRYDYGILGQRCRLKFNTSLTDWDFAIYKYSDERYDPDEWFFPGAESVDGTIEGAMRAGLAAYA